MKSEKTLFHQNLKNSDKPTCTAKFSSSICNSDLYGFRSLGLQVALECAEAVRCLKSEALSNGIGIETKSGVAEGGSSGSDSLRTYKRRKHVRLSLETKVREDCSPYVETVNHLAHQAVKKPCDVIEGNTSDEKFSPPVNNSGDCSHRNWGNVVLKHMHQLLGDDKGGIQGCIREAIIYSPKISCTTSFKESYHSDRIGQDCSSQTGWIFGSEHATNGHASFMLSESLNELGRHTITEMCQRAFYNILISEKFTSLCKVLFENFQGIKPESVFNFSIINSRMKEGAYEQSPSLFISDVQQIWRKLEDSGSEIVSLAKSLSNMSRTSYTEQFCTRESDSHTKSERPGECGLYKVCSCRCCGEKADGKDYLVCDSCEEIYHVSCIQPAVKEIPHKSWYCASCTASGFGSPHDNCMVCEKLNAQKSLNNGVGDGNFPTDEGILNELEENSNCSTYDGLLSEGEKNTCVCKICRNNVEDDEKLRICGHSFCPNKYYHARCLTTRQLNSYGPCWYCPSCLCRACLTDQDDDKIVLCDGCDHAYHIYCMKPPRTSIPRGKWFCRKCDVEMQAIRRAKRAYESLGSKPNKADQEGLRACKNLEMKWDDKHGQGLDKGGGMDMLLTAAKTLNYEEKLACVQIE
ncbi:Methyl-CpG-binding domain-containing protein 9 [Quillaja saponaria]|uniref:Methyl-CpG-binding domain-containing protein 9 n=1 Tax=Quillaja saponaria TaxID=32244 RepID=A0AAD7PRG1_QUISA|nr:Methyl-CpG-binding domain-containing protein 9 [Quillaja saponaria]